MTKRQKKYIKNRAEGMSKKEAALAAGYSKETADNAKGVIESSKSFQELVNSYLPRNKILSVIQEGLEATAVKNATHEGKITDEKVYADYPTRARFADIALKIHGDYAAEKRTIEITEKPQTKEEIVSALNEIAQKEGISLEVLCEREGLDI